VTNAELSPTDFSLSVHNAWAGMLSIINENARGHSALAAGPDTFAFGLLEALTILRTEPSVPVLLLFTDEPLPEIYQELVGNSDETMAMGIILRSALDKEGRSFFAEMLPGDGSESGLVGQAEAFLKCVVGGNEIEMCGQRINWRMRANVAAD
jgi:hypothetical protein